MARAVGGRVSAAVGRDIEAVGATSASVWPKPMDSTN